MSVIACSAAGCGKPYQVNEYSTQFIFGNETSKIVCPHCGNVTMGREDFVYLTHAANEHPGGVTSPPRGA